MERHEILMILEVLNERPTMISHLDECLAGWLIDNHLYDDMNNTLTPLALDLIHKVQSIA
jgi:hypothetical protein